MMINVNQITAQLARMPDQALQQYAQMHKSDPYVLSLALAESNRRKEMRQGAQMNAPQQPKVVDQEIQGMAAPMPEHVGIGQLPAGNMNFADGGIVAFGSGGDVPGYADGDLVDAYGLGASPEALERRRRAMLKAMLEETGRARQSVAQGSEYSPERYGVTTPAPTFTDPRLVGAAPSAQTVAAAPSAPTGAAPTADTGAAGAKGPGQRVPPAGAPGAAASSPAAGGFAPGQGLGLSSTPSTLSREYESFMPQGAVTDPFAAQTGELGQAGIKAAKEYKETREKQLDALGIFGLDQERRLKERETKLSKQEGEIGPLALLQAGFAMMAGSSPHAMQNIGVGAQVGLKNYTEGVDKLDAAREKLDDAFSRLEATRRSEKMLTDKERAELGRDLNKSYIDAQKLTLDGAKQAYGWERDKAKTLFEAYAKEKLVGAEVGSRERLGLAQIAAQRDIAGGRNALMEKLYGGDVKARQEFGKLQQSVMKELSSNTAYSMEQDPTKKQAMYNQALQRAIQGNPFLAAYSAGIGFTKAPPPGKVLDLTE